MKCMFALMVLISLHGSSQSKPLFTLLAPKQTGINFSNEIIEDEAKNVLSNEYFYNGGGVAIGDINNDGLQDIFFTANLKSNKLYLNEANFQFKDITKTAKIAGRNDWKTGCTMVDVNGDGWLDIYVCYSGKGNTEGRRNELYVNNHDNTFTERAKEYGLDDKGCSTQAIFFDFDRDGDLDCYVINHNVKAYKNVGLHYLKNDYDSFAADHLYRNDDGHFVDVSKVAGISGNPISFGLGIAVSDINNDGWPDLYVSNDYTEQDYLYINNRNGTFSQREMYAFGHMSQFSMGNDVADINNDGFVDIVTLDMLPEDNRRQKLLQGQENYELYQYMIENGFHYQYMRNMLQLNNGNGTFSEIGQLAGISNTDWSWAPLLADFDNDGYKDLFVTNGYMRDYTNKDFLKYWGDYLVKQAVNRDSVHYFDIVKMMPSTNVANYAFKNNGDLTYKNVSEQWGLKEFSLSNGAAYADLDNDGDLDLIVNNINEAAFIFRNESFGKNYLNVQLKGSGKNTFGLGSKLYCYTKNKMQFLEQMPTRGYQSSVSGILHFGIGDEQVDSLKIVWPNGAVQQLENIAADQLLTLEQKNAKPVNPPIATPVRKLFSYQKPLIGYSHLQLEYNDFKRQPLMPVMLSPSSPKMAKADINGDGLEDIFIGSSQGQSSQLFVQTKNGFTLSQQPIFLSDSNSVTTSVIFFDADGDGDFDVYCTSGGYNDFIENDERLQDRLFINDGKGSFQLAKDNLPSMHVSKSVVAAGDYDNDGDLDLFIGGRVVPGMYPQNPQSFLLQNDGKGKFTDVTRSVAPQLQFAGMITDAKWWDYNHDGKKDLLVVGEWMAPTIFENSGLHLIASFDSAQLANSAGWWNTIELADLDNDGDTDIVIGNWGLNSQLKSSPAEPLAMIYKDFDNNGSIDPFLCCYIEGKQYPYISRDELLDEIYPMRKKFTSYKSYADATMMDIFVPDELKDANVLMATNLATAYFENRNGKFYSHALPVQAQFSSVDKIIVEDFNGDHSPDILLLGNNEYPRLKLGKMDANFGTLLLNDGKGNFSFSENRDNGLFIAGDVKDAMILHINGSEFLLAGINGADLINFKLNQ